MKPKDAIRRLLRPFFPSMEAAAPVVLRHKEPIRHPVGHAPKKRNRPVIYVHGKRNRRW